MRPDQAGGGVSGYTVGHIKMTEAPKKMRRLIVLSSLLILAIKGKVRLCRGEIMTGTDHATPANHQKYP